MKLSVGSRVSAGIQGVPREFANCNVTVVCTVKRVNLTKILYVKFKNTNIKSLFREKIIIVLLFFYPRDLAKFLAFFCQIIGIGTRFLKAVII